MTRRVSTFQAPQLQSPPGTGGRVELRLRPSPEAAPADLADAASPEAGSAPVAIYVARWATSERTWDGEIQVDADGRVQIRAADPPPPAWLTEFSAQLLRTTARSVLGGSAPWPRRLTRWRAAPTTS